MAFRWYDRLMTTPGAIPEQLVDRVRDRILSGLGADDQPIRQDALAGEFGVSKIPLREALARLEQEGLIRSRANRGFFVRGLSAAEAEEVYDLRHTLEPAAMARAALLAGDAEQNVARDTFANIDRIAQAGGSGVGAFNRMLHRALYAPCRRPVTIDLLDRLQVLSERYVRKHLEPLGRDLRADAEHRALLDAWLARDAATVTALGASHIDKTLADLNQQLTGGQ